MRISLDHLWLWLALLLPALASLIVALPAVDLAWQLRAGELILSTGAIPSTDTFTFTAHDAPWTDQQWLAQVVLALLYRLGGWELLAVLRAGLVAVTFGLVAAAVMARGAPARTAAILSLLAFVLATPTLALRPQLFGIVLFALLLWLVADRRRHPRRLWLAPMVIALWANVHGSVVIAPVLLGYAWLEDLVEGRLHRPSLAVLAIGALATLVNPFGIGVWGYAVGIGMNAEITSQVAEWQRTTPFTVSGLLFYVTALAVAGVLVARRRRDAWPLYLWLATLFVIGAWTVRGLAWWPLGAAVAVAPLLPKPSIASRQRVNLLNTAMVGVLGLAIVGALPWWRPADPLTGRVGLLSYAPSELALALWAHARPGDRVFVPQTWGSWFEWAVPDAGYFADSRIELLPSPVWADYTAINAGGPQADEILGGYGVTIVLAEASGALETGLRDDSRWVSIAADGNGSIFVRQVAP